MKITKARLKQIIKEELEAALQEADPEPVEPAPDTPAPAKPAQIDPLKFAGMLCQAMGGPDGLVAMADQVIEDPTTLAGLAQQHAKVLIPILKQFGIPDLGQFVNTVQPVISTMMEGFVKQAKAASEAAQRWWPIKIPIPEEILRQSAIALAKGLVKSVITTACQ
jgi:hypothetical protein